MSGGTLAEADSSSRGPPTYTVCPSDLARTPRPFSASKSVTCGKASFFSSAADRMPPAIVCSESRSTAAASASARSSVQPDATAMATTPKRPSVSVPVLSKMIVSIRRASRSARAVAHEDAVVRPLCGRDCNHKRNGQAQRVRAGDHQHGGDAGDDFDVEADGDRPGNCSQHGHTQRNVEEPGRRLVGQHLRARLAGLRFLPSRMIPASAVCSPVAVTRTRRLPSPLIVPAMTFAPNSFFTGRDSPVIIDSLTSDSPRYPTAPLAGTLAPGRISTTSPSRNWLAGTSSVDPSGCSRSAVSGISLASASTRPEACRTLRISSQ